MLKTFARKISHTFCKLDKFQTPILGFEITKSWKEQVEYTGSNKSLL